MTFPSSGDTGGDSGAQPRAPGRRLYAGGGCDTRQLTETRASALDRVRHESPLRSVCSVRGSQTTVLLRRLGEGSRGRRFNPTLRTDSLPHQIATSRFADWPGVRLVPEH